MDRRLDQRGRRLRAQPVPGALVVRAVGAAGDARREAAGLKQILRKYRDRKIDLADACLIRLADEFGTADILTLDQDFAIYRWGKNKPFRMLPRT